MTDAFALAPPHLLAFLVQHGIAADFHAPGVPMPTVARAPAAMNVPEEQILKTLLFVDACGNHIVAIAGGSRRIDRELLARASDLLNPRPASPEAVLVVTGYPAGGVAPLGISAGVPVIVDTRVLDLPVAYGGGGREDLLLRVVPADVVRCNQASVAPILQPAEPRLPAG